MKIIAFAGQMESGKSTAALFTEAYLASKNGEQDMTVPVARLAFAKAFKDICMKYFGFTESQLYTPEGKAAYDKFWNMTPREFMQKLGQGLREAICDDIWVKVMEKEIKHYQEYGPKDQVIIIDDVRYPNEAEMLHRYGAYLINIIRPNHVPAFKGVEGHSSERPLPDEYVDSTICNNGTKDQLKHTLERCLKAHAI